MNNLDSQLDRAKTILENNGVIGLPTETVYGLAGNIYSEEAISEIYRIKNRPTNNPLIVHIGDFEMLNEIAEEIPEYALYLAKKYWPGPLTLLLKKNKNVADFVTAGSDLVAIRMPDHPIALELLKSLDFPLAAPSANPSGQISPTCAEHVRNYFPTQIPLILDGGECEKGIESTIVGFENNVPVIYRFGSLDLEDELKEAWSKAPLSNSEPTTPGMLYQHYAPKTETISTENIETIIAIHHDKLIGVLSYSFCEIKDKNSNVLFQEHLTENNSLVEAAKNLYQKLHHLDQLNLDLIVCELVPNVGIGKAINDKLIRASHKKINK